MKKFVLALTLVLTGCSTQFMDKAIVADVEGLGSTVLFENANGTFRPQFTSDCGKYKSPSAGRCEIARSRLTNIRKM